MELEVKYPVQKKVKIHESSELRKQSLSIEFKILCRKKTLVPYDPLTVMDVSHFSRLSIVCSSERLEDSFCESTA